MLLGAAFLLRVVILLVRSDNLTIDRDAYLAIAENLVNGHGFCSIPGSPTAFRPPVYPLFLAGCLTFGSTVIIGIAQAILGTLTVALTRSLGRQHGLNDRAALAAATLVAVDPLLLEYTSHLMTETLCTFLVVCLLLRLTSDTVLTTRGAAWTGLVAGLCVLCRPGLWAFLGLVATIRIAASVRSRNHGTSADARAFRTKVGFPVITMAVLALTIAPWMIRNWVVIGKPTALTTHGGYTLALGNNEHFYRDVVSKDAGAVWASKDLETWQESVRTELASRSVSESNEPAVDLAHSELAWTWIRKNPTGFTEAAWLRIRRLWAIAPASDSFGRFAVWCVSVWYGLLFVAAAIGLVKSRRQIRCLSVPLALMIAITCVHIPYWANTRMRAPMAPTLCILAVFAVSGSRIVNRNQNSHESA